MISFPHAKINLGLSVVSKRPDGFHNLETIFYPLYIRDILEIVPSPETRFIPTGLSIPGNLTENLVVRAFDLLKKKHAGIAAMEIHLHKAIPMGAGLGGGSSDAAEMLQLMNLFFGLGISKNILGTYALELGSDCPFFLQNRPCFASGRGEILEPLTLDLSDYSFILVHSGIRITTAWAFSVINPSPSRHNLKKIIAEPIENWKTSIVNDFEAPVFTAYPSLKSVKDQLYKAGALYSAMTGSGSTIYGIFPKSTIPHLDFENARQTIIE
jgi:4-diphosphocytidyl-2-C-methyl-D-erythritol kinase